MAVNGPFALEAIKMMNKHFGALCNPTSGLKHPFGGLKNSQSALKSSFLPHFLQCHFPELRVSMDILDTQTACDACSWAPPLSVLLKLRVIVLYTHSYHPPKFRLNPNHHNGVLILAHLTHACCLLACCCCCLLKGVVPPWTLRPVINLHG